MWLMSLEEEGYMDIREMPYDDTGEVWGGNRQGKDCQESLATTSS